MKLLHFIILGMIATLATTIAPTRTVAQKPATPDTKQFLNCLSRYPQTPAQGRQAVTRYEFAVELDACLNEVTQPLQPGNLVRKTELDEVTQRQQELNQELRKLRDRVDSL